VTAPLFGRAVTGAQLPIRFDAAGCWQACADSGWWDKCLGVSRDDTYAVEGENGRARLGPNHRRSFTVQFRLNYIAPLLAAGGAAVAIAAAPMAAAAPTPQQSCGASSSGTVCQSPGNVQINDSPPPVSFYPYGGDAFLLGGGGHGGGHR
jgi:hypothetical protein